MSVDKNSVATADVAALRAYGKEVMGENFAPAMKEENIRKKVADHLGIEITDSPPTEAPPVAKRFKAPKPGKMYASKADAIADKVTIKIPIEKGEGGDQDVFVGWNGQSYLIQRGKEIDIPYGAFCSLMDAVTTEFYQSDMDNAMTSSDAQTIPVQLINDPRAAER